MMVLNKRTYDECKLLMDEKEKDVLEEYLNELNERLIVNYAQDYLENTGKNIKTDLRNSNRFKNILKCAIDSKLSYQIGSFNTVICIFEILVYKENVKDAFIKRIKALNSKKNMNRLLWFLYKNPDSQHKNISEALDLKKNYLSELLRELEDADCVDRYTLGKRSFYTLSKDANEFLRAESKDDFMNYKFRRISHGKYNVSEIELKYGSIRMCK